MFDQSPSQTLGPMYGFALCDDGLSRSVGPDDSRAIRIEGLLLDGDDEPIAYPDGMVEIWQGAQFTRGRTDPFGLWRVHVAKPLDTPPLASGRPQAPHLHVTVLARGLLKQAQTRLYFPDEREANAVDPVLTLVEPGRRGRLVARPAGVGRLRFDIRLQGEGETVFFAF